VEQLNEMIEEGEAATAINGLLQQAKQAMEQGQFSDALAPLNEAAKKAPKTMSSFSCAARRTPG